MNPLVMPLSLDLLVVPVALVLIVAVVATRLGDKLGLPSLLLFLGLGVAFELPSGGGLFNDVSLAHDLGFIALILILAEGGLSTKWNDIRPAIGPSLALATLGVSVTIAVMSLFGFFVLKLSLALSVLLAAVLASTDAAAVFSVLRNVPLPPRVRAVLEGESGFNDAPTVLIVIAATELALGEAQLGDSWIIGVEIVLKLVGGLAIGLVIGWLGVRVLRQLALPAPGLYPLAQLGWAVLAYAADFAHASGFASVYVCSLVLGNGKLPHRHATRSFAAGVGWLVQIGLFVMLGLLASPDRLTVRIVVIALAAGLFVAFVARPLSVVIALAPFRMPWREQAFVSWAGLRGAVPIILMTIPRAAGVPASDDLFDLVFVLVVVLTLLNGPTLPWVARRLGLTSDTTDVDIEVAPLDKVEADLLQVGVPEGSRLHGVSVSELRLPPNSTVTLVIRGTKTFTPHGRDIIRTGDELLIVTPGAQRSKVEDRLRAVGRSGRLASWTEAVRRSRST